MLLLLLPNAVILGIVIELTDDARVVRRLPVFKLPARSEFATFRHRSRREKVINPNITFKCVQRILRTTQGPSVTLTSVTVSHEAAYRLQ